MLIVVFVEKPFVAVAPDWQKNEFFYKSGDLAFHYNDSGDYPIRRNYL